MAETINQSQVAKTGKRKKDIANAMLIYKNWTTVKGPKSLSSISNWGTLN